jgi:citrate lyase beta subunit
MYTPALNKTIAENLITQKFILPDSITFCLEDSITDASLSKAQNQLTATLEKIESAASAGKISIDGLPLIFVRIRSPQHMSRIFHELGGLISLVSGFVLPKFSLRNAIDYKTAAYEINARADKPVYLMPILESKSVISARNRVEALFGLKEILDAMKEIVLNIRVGGNDFCNLYAVRRNVSQTIYDVAVVNGVIADILNIFSGEYIVSAPVWEYFDSGIGGAWKTGLIRELERDALNGFIGKTAIHPSQVPVIRECMKVSAADFADARSLLSWTGASGVAKSAHSARMNEVKVHRRWAEKIVTLAEIYGVRK